MKIAICDDNTKIINEVRTEISNYFNEKTIKVEISTFTNGEDLLNCNITFDMAFLDV